MNEDNGQQEVAESSQRYRCFYWRSTDKHLYLPLENSLTSHFPNPRTQNFICHSPSRTLKTDVKVSVGEAQTIFHPRCGRQSDFDFSFQPKRREKMTAKTPKVS